jgi:hypothetical protein
MAARIVTEDPNRCNERIEGWPWDALLEIHHPSKENAITHAFVNHDLGDLLDQHLSACLI